MADITSRKANTDSQQGVVLSFEVKASTSIPEGALVALDGGYAINGGDDSGTTFVGVAEESVDNSAGASGAVKIKVLTQGVITTKISSTATIATVGVEVYVEDNQTVSILANAANEVYVGRVVEFIDAGTVRVALANLGDKRTDATA